MSRIQGAVACLVSRRHGEDRRSIQEPYHHGLSGRHTSNAEHITQPETDVITAANSTGVCPYAHTRVYEIFVRKLNWPI